MKRMVLMAALVGVFAVTGIAQTNKGQGHTAPKTQPATGPAMTVPTGEMALGSVHIPKGVKADGKPLAAGTYQVRVTADTASQEAKGQTKSLERWAEFMKGGKVVGREVVTIVPQADIGKVQKDSPPRAGASKVEMLKGGDYFRVWFNKGGTHYLMHLPA